MLFLYFLSAGVCVYLIVYMVKQEVKTLCAWKVVERLAVGGWGGVAEEFEKCLMKEGCEEKKINSSMFFLCPGAD